MNLKRWFLTLPGPQKGILVGSVVLLATLWCLFLVVALLTFGLPPLAATPQALPVSKAARDTPAPTFAHPPVTLPPTLTQSVETATSTPAWSVPACLPHPDEFQTGWVTEVVDGDTIRVRIDGQEYPLRYIGIDTPERTFDRDALAAEAARANSALVSGKAVRLYRDTSETDSFGRLLRYVVAGEVFVNDALVKMGYAQAKDYPPDSACSEQLARAQAEAIAAGLGLWSPEAQAPTDTAVAQRAPAQGLACPGGCVEHLPGCDIKGNINSEGVKIYHDFSSPFYDATVINPSKGERWFCTAEEAVAAGWRAPRN